MEKQLITLFFLLFISVTDSASCKCKSFENNIYQMTATLPGLQPFYGLVTLLPNGMFIETNNIANGQDTAEVGVNLLFNVHTGYYDCAVGNKLTLIDTGYIYKTNALAVLTTNGAIAVHEYDLQFLNNDSRACTGTLRFGFYPTGSNPFNSTSTPVFISANAVVTCVLLSGRGFTVPTST